MCGIVGLVSTTPVSNRLVEGLKRLEYRGYDSAGVATLQGSTLDRRRASGKLVNLEELLTHSPLEGNVGIGHTRWATHGKPTVENSHPHASEKVAVVHNGIIENYALLKQELEQKGVIFESQTDTEVVAHLMTDFLNSGLSPIQSLKEMLLKIEGAFALAILVKGYNDRLLVAKKGSPLVIGFSDTQMCVGSDALVLAPWTKKLCYLHDGDYGEVFLNTATLYDDTHSVVNRPLKETNLDTKSIGKGSYRHFMLKEIHEQPTALLETLRSFVSLEHTINWASLSSLTIVACGTSYYAGMVAKYWFEQLANLKVDVDIASEFRYRHPVIDSAGGAYLFISQSGETIDTLAAMEMVKSKNAQTLAIVNVPESSLSRLVDQVFYTLAGPEIGVASTKAFTTQLSLLASLALQAAHHRNALSKETYHCHLEELLDTSTLIESALEQTNKIEKISDDLSMARDVIYLGRGIGYPVALEGALKLKEISYIHAEGYPSGELKHGPIALIDKNVPVVVIAPSDEWFLKTLSNVQEVLARGAKVIAICDHMGTPSFQSIKSDYLQIIEMPSTTLVNAPIVYSIAVQLLAYFTACKKGTDVDQPRNLAKSVTVE